MPRTAEWVDAQGQATTMRLEPGALGRFMPTIEIKSSPAVGTSGARVDNIRHGGRLLGYPMWFEGPTEIDAHQAARDWCARLDPLGGLGQIRETSEAGDVRTIGAYYTGGAEGDESLERQGRTYVRWVLSFLAPDPYWEEEGAFAASYRIDGVAVPFLPFLPIVVSEANILGPRSVPNTGDVKAWPVWTLRGPIESARFALPDGRAWEFVEGAQLGGDEVLTVDTREDQKTVTDAAGANRFGMLTAASSLWALPKGTTTVDMIVTGATADTEVSLWFKRRYLTR